MTVEANKARQFRFYMAPIALMYCLVSSLGSNGPAHEGRRYQPYRDSSGIWTVCAGVTGERVVPDRHYTQAECHQLEQAYVEQMLHAIGDCIDGTFTFNEVIAWGHFAYNVGTQAFCQSHAARLLNAGAYQLACEEMSKWVFVNGKDCRVPANRCGGIVVRRAWEQALCQRESLTH